MDVKSKNKKINLGENIDEKEMKRFVKKILVEIKKDEKEEHKAKELKKEEDNRKKEEVSLKNIK